MTQSKLILFFLLCSVVAFLPLDVRLRCDFIRMDHNNATSFWCRDQGRDGFVSRQLDMCSAFNCYVYFAKLPFYVDFRGRKNQNSDEEIKWIEIKSNELCKWYIAVDDDVDDDPTRWKGKIVEFTNIDRAHRLWIAIWANTYGNCWIYIFDVCHSFSPYDSGSNQFGNFIMRAPCNFLVLFVLFFFLAIRSLFFLINWSPMCSSYNHSTSLFHATRLQFKLVFRKCCSNSSASGTRGRSSCRDVF